MVAQRQVQTIGVNNITTAYYVGVMVELVEHQPLDLVIPDSDPYASWMFVFDFVLWSCTQVKCDNNEIEVQSLIIKKGQTIVTRKDHVDAMVHFRSTYIRSLSIINWFA